MELLTKEKIRAADDRPTRRVHVPEWGGDVIVCTMDGALRAQYEEQLRSGESGLERIRAVLVALTTTDEQGNLLFTTDDVDWLNAKSAAALDRVFDVSIRLNKLRKQDLDELEKNSETGPSAGS